MKPLYLQGKTGMKVDFDEPALAVFLPDKTRQLFPLARVSRVIVCGHIDWSMSALFACADVGINVIFMNALGEIRSRWLGKVTKKQNFLQLYRDLFQRRDALSLYQNWFAGMQRMVVRSAARKLGFEDWQLAEASLLNAWLSNALSKDWMLAKNVMHGFIFSAVIQYLADMGWDSGDTNTTSGDIQLADDLSDLLLWDLYPLFMNLQSKSEWVPEPSSMIDLFERRKHRIEHLMRGLMNMLLQCLRSVE